MRKTRGLRIAALLAVGAIAVAACGDDDDGTDTAATTTAGGAATTAAGTATTGGGTATTAGAATTVDVSKNEASADGVSKDEYTIGFVWAATGVAAPNNTGMLKAAQARVDLENAKGGVFGRTIKLEQADDAGTPTQNLSAVQSLVEQKKVFVVINQTPFAFGGYRYTTEKGIPVLGGGYDGPEWFQQPNTNMISIGGNNSENAPQFTGLATFIKEQGGSRVGAMGYGQSPSSTSAAKKFHDLAVPAAGLTPAYLNTSIPFGSVDVATIALDMKNANVDSVYLPMNNNTNFAIVTAAQQAGVDLKVAISATGYGQTLLDQPSAVAAAQGAYFAVGYQPVELQTEATKAMQEGLAEYADFTGVPGFDHYQGWVTADLLIKGLQEAGQNPTRESFLEGLRALGEYDAGGLNARPVDISLEGFGKAPAEICSYMVKLEGTEFVPAPESGEPICGTLVPGSDTP